MDDRSARAGSPEPERAVAGVRLTRPDRPLLPSGPTKGELAAYFERASRWILAHAADRPLALVRCPRSGEASCFVQRHATAGLPAFVRRAQVPDGARTRTGFCVDSVQGLVALAQIGGVEIRPWNARVSELGTPDRMVFDVDPSPDVPWTRTLDAAKAVREALETRGLRSFAKLSGVRGVHVVVPLSPEHGWEEVFRFSRDVAEDVARRRPSRCTPARSRAARKGRILIDARRNAQGQSLASAYSPRAARGAPVSLPVSWEELSAGRSPESFPIARTLERLESLEEDPWAGFHRLAQTLPRDDRPVPRGGGESQA